MKSYYVSEELKPYLRKILIRRFYEHRFVRRDGKDYCQISITNAGFHKLIKRAACEKRSAEEGVAYITKEESANPMYASNLKKELGVTAALVYGTETH